MAAGGYNNDEGAWMATVEFMDYETGQWVRWHLKCVILP